MIGRRDKATSGDKANAGPKGFDDFDLKLGDMMRGERATLGKSLLDVQRDLKIKANYIAAIENADLDAFETKGFVAGYVRSYARYLKMDPEWAFEAFCRDSGFSNPLGIDSKARAKPAGARSQPVLARAEGGLGGSVNFVPQTDSFLSRVEPGAIGSMLVMLTLLGALGYGAMTVLHEVQQVRMTPVEQAPGVLAELDPLAEFGVVADAGDVVASPVATAPQALNRLYRPQALDVPVMTPRDGPIAALDPASVGVLADRTDRLPDIDNGDGAQFALVDPGLARAVRALDDAAAAPALEAPKVLADQAPDVMLVALDDAWVRVRDADGSILLEKIMLAGESFVLPATEAPATLRTGAAGNVYFMVNGETFGPAGGRGAVVADVALSPEDLTQRFARVEPGESARNREAVRVAEAALVEKLNLPQD